MFPSNIQIETTTRCPADCMMCPHRFVARPDLMPIGLIRKILDECVGKDVTIIPHQMGDLLADPRALEILKMCKDRGLKVLMSTSGALLDKEKCRAIVSMGVDIINLSMDSLDKRTYERIRRVSFDKVMRNIDDLLAAKKPPTEVWVSAVDISFNKKTRAGFLKYWGSRADRVQITPYVRYPKVRNWRLPHKKAKDSARCQRLESDMVILSNGEAAKCCIDFEGATSFGNVAEKSLAAIWNGAGRADLLEEMRKSGRKKLYPCNICSI